MKQINAKSVQVLVLLTKSELPYDLLASIRIAHWACEQTEKSAGQVWIAQKEFRHLGPGWQELLSI